MTYRILIVTADAVDCRGLLGMLGEAADGPFNSEQVKTLSAALGRVQEGGIDAVLLDLALPDSQGIDTFKKLFAVAPKVPIMTLCVPEDETLALQALECGAQGYLLKGLFASYLVAQSLSHIIQRQTMETHFGVEKVRAELTLNSISDAVIGTDLQGNVDYLNTAAENMTGWPRDDAHGQPIDQVMYMVDGETAAAAVNPVRLVLEQKQPMGMTAGSMLVRRDGSNVAIEDSAAPILDPGGQISGAVVVFHDVSEARAMAMRMAYLAQHDPLTRLPNRVLLSDRIAQAISLAERSGNAIALMFLDLDHFKHINDSLGHAAGDQLLQIVAQRLSACVRSTDTVSRNGGDEFVVLLAEGRDMQDASVIAHKIIAALSAPYSIDQHELHMTCSIGISVYPADADSAEGLLKNADTAMYHAKEVGRNNYQFFKHAMNVRAVERQVIESNLWQALDRREFMLHYQPKVNLATGVITGAEALLRWLHPQWGVTLPERFVAIAEECGLIVPIGRWVLREACLQAACWREKGFELPTISVNFCALEFRHPDFVAGVQAILDESGLPPACLQLEITESVLMRDADSSAEILRQLKDIGVQLAMDDFGTGYSSLSYLLKFPIDVLKIDKSFVHSIGAGDGAIVSAVIAMCASLSYQVVAEGVENDTQLAFLQGELCQEGQGYLFSHGVASEPFTVLLQARKCGMPVNAASESEARL
ncbi:EAL domain-containing protein [Pseudomonas sp. PDM15]|jgi:diguanylate cyclase (GGDEF)-like protein/PAS domain S-box-containing protein|uniref:two-component system response regulator n=1 Tax=Pseudomonas sp. PDM15 TaxID=2769303 RepID=UPI001784F0F0|nr:EAL domain-containing protein [Pseudomonas sp. PDM15]MBD9425056.1 EAL domain-containing protein [Pseudomonas sp. PDM15]